MMKPIISIGVCVKNGERYIKYAIDSILKQKYDYKLMELIFVDDGSTDNTLSIIEANIKNINIKSKIFSTEWKGTGPARNLVVKNANSKYILWVDSDMILTKNYVQKLVNFMEKNNGVGIATGILGMFPKRNIVLNLELIPFIIKYLNQKNWVHKDASKLPGTAGSIYRIKSIKNIGGFDEKIVGAGEDINAAKRIRDAGWLISQVDSIFYETHNFMSTWRDLWKKYYWYGYTSYNLYLQNKHPFSLYRMTPISSFILSLLILIPSYKILRNKSVFLLPFHFIFKSFAWCIGFLMNQCAR